jgi:hypothetical protein
VLVLRNALVLLLAPAIISWFIAVRYTRRPLFVFATVYGLSLVLFFCSALLSPPFNLPANVVNRQQQFMALKGNTRFGLDTLSASLPGFVKVFPQAFANSFLRPWIWEAKGILQVMAALETSVFWLLLLLIIARRKKESSATWQQPLVWVLLFSSVTLYLFIGYTVPFPGAIVRYKTIPELFLFVLLLINIRLQRS